MTHDQSSHLKRKTMFHVLTLTVISNTTRRHHHTSAEHRYENFFFRLVYRKVEYHMVWCVYKTGIQLEVPIIIYLILRLPAWV